MTLSRLNRALFGTTIVTTLFDALTTVYGLSVGLAEANTVIVGLGEYIGIIPSLFVIKILSVLVIYGLLRVVEAMDDMTDRFETDAMQTGMLVVFTLGYLAIGIHNLQLALSVS